MPVAFHKLTFRYMRKLSHSNVLRKYMYCDRKGISPFKHGCALLPYVFLTRDEIIASMGSSTTKVMIYNMNAG